MATDSCVASSTIVRHHLRLLGSDSKHRDLDAQHLAIYFINDVEGAKKRGRCESVSAVKSGPHALFNCGGASTAAICHGTLFACEYHLHPSLFSSAITFLRRWAPRPPVQGYGPLVFVFSFTSMKYRVIYEIQRSTAQNNLREGER